MGLTTKKIATNAGLLGRDQETLWNNYHNLEQMGLTTKKIATIAQLLGPNPETIQNNYDKLKSMGLTDTKIATNPGLLVRNPEVIQTNYENLQRRGLNDTQIATNASLLGLNPKSVGSKYGFLVGLLRDDYTDRNSGKEVILSNPVLLGSSRATVESNAQFLYSLGVDAGENSWLLGTTVKKKREKMAWVLREVFDYREAPQEKKKDLIYSMQDFLKDRLHLLSRSLNGLEKRKCQLRETAAEYLK